MLSITFPAYLASSLHLAYKFFKTRLTKMASSLWKVSRVLHKYRCSALINVHKSLTLQYKGFKSSCQLFGATPIKMPALSPTMQEGTIVKWYKKEGDTIAPGDILCDIQTDKAVMGMEVEEEGILAKIIKPDDSKDVQIGVMIAVMVEEGEDWENVEVPADTEVDSAPAVEPTQEPASSPPPPPQPAAAAAATQSTEHFDIPKGVKIGPAVRSLAEIYSIALGNVKPTGPQGRILKGDVLSYIKEKNLSPAERLEAAPAQPMMQQVGAPAPPPPTPVRVTEGEGYLDIELSTMRKVIAKRLTESKTTIPHSYSTIDCDMGNVLDMRKDFQKDGIKVSVNDFIIKAAAVALQRVPEVNALWTGESARLMQEVDVSVAVATDNGLITPIVKDAASLGVQQISDTVRDLATRARENKLQLNEFQGGTFTISNLGMFGITEFSAVINPPQACILAVGSSRVCLGDDNTPRTLMTVTLSSDARIVDDYLATRFLSAFKENLENPMLMTAKTIPDRDSLMDTLFA